MAKDVKAESPVVAENDNLAPVPDDDLDIVAGMGTGDPDGFDEDNYILGPDEEDDLETEKLTVPGFGKHQRDIFYMRHKDPKWNSVQVWVKESGMDGLYVVGKKMVPVLADHGIHKRQVYSLINREGEITFACYKLEDKNGNLDNWNKSAHRIMREEAQTEKWFKMVASKKNYVVRRAINPNLDPPEWPEGKTFMELFKQAIEDWRIDDKDHAIVKALLGSE